MLQVPLATVLREWGRIGCIGFGGPPAHIRLLRQLCVERRGWLDAREFEDAIAVCNLMPGPASTQLAIFCAWRLRGRPGALIGGAAFIIPGLIVILALAALFLAPHPPLWVLRRRGRRGRRRARRSRSRPAGRPAAPPAGAAPAAARRSAGPRYLAAGLAAAATIGAWLVLVLLGCGAIELLARYGRRSGWRARREAAADRGCTGSWPLRLSRCAARPAAGCWRRWRGWRSRSAALSFGGGFVIIPLMQADAVSRYHWMTGAQFLNAVALGQVTPGPVVQTVAVVGYAAAGLGGGLLAAAVAFAPSFLFVLLGGPRFEQIRANQRARAFLDGAGPAAIGAILGSAITLTRELAHPWQYAVLARRPRPAAPAAPRRRPGPAVSRRDRRHPRPGRRHHLALTSVVNPFHDPLVMFGYLAGITVRIGFATVRWPPWAWAWTPQDPDPAGHHRHQQPRRICHVSRHPGRQAPY